MVVVVIVTAVLVLAVVIWVVSMRLRGSVLLGVFDGGCDCDGFW